MEKKPGVFLKTTYCTSNSYHLRPSKLVEKLAKYDSNEHVNLSFKGVGYAQLGITVGELISYLKWIGSMTYNENSILVAMLEGVRFEITNLVDYDPTLEFRNGEEEYSWEVKVANNELPELLGVFDIECRLSKNARENFKANGGNNDDLVLKFR